MAAWSPSSSSSLSSKNSSPRNVKGLNATIFGMNRLSISDGPRNVIKCLDADRSGQNGSGPLARQLYLNEGLATADRMYTTDMIGHHSCVNTIALSNHGEQFLVSAGDDQRVLVWKVPDVIQASSRHPTPIVMNACHTSNIFTANFSCDNDYIYSGGDDCELIKHDFRTGQPISHHEHLDAVYSVAPHPTLPSVVITASEDGCVYTIDTRQPCRRVNYDMVLCEDMEAYHCATINPVEPRLVAVCNSYTGTSLYDIRRRSKRLLHYKFTKWPIAREDAVSACFDSSGSQLYVMHRTFPPCLFDLWNEDVKLSFMDNTGSYKNLVTMKSGCFMGQKDEYVVSGSDDFRVYVWKVPACPQEGEKHGGWLDIDSCVSTMPHLILPGHRSIVNQTCYSKVHRILITSGVEKVIKIWSHERLNASNKVSHSRSPPARSRYSLSEMDNLMNSSPADPLSEDPSVLAFFDSLLEGESSSIFDDSSLTDPEDNDLSSPSSPRFPRTLMELPFFGFWLSHNESEDSDATPTDSELSFANTSSLEPPWSEDELEAVDQELRETYRGDLDEWSSYDSSDHTSSDSRGGSEGDGRGGRVSYHHDYDVEEGDKSRMRKKENEQVCNGVSSGASDRDLRVSSGSMGNNSRSSSSRSGSLCEPTRQQPSRKVKKACKDRGNSSANCHSDQTLLNGDGSKNKQHQPRRKVKSAQPNLSGDHGAAAMATSSHAGATASGSSTPTGESHSQNSGACSSRKGGTSNRSGGASSSRHIQTSGACAGINSGPNTGPSRKWTKKNNIRHQQAAGTASNNYEQYNAEDFLKPIPPSSFYTKK